MNEIILAPCDVISKIKQNSSDMNEIILASCDAGYVQSCTGFDLSLWTTFPTAAHCFDCYTKPSTNGISDMMHFLVKISLLLAFCNIPTTVLCSTCVQSDAENWRHCDPRFESDIDALCPCR
jgi:hypothetical protein